MTSVENIKNTEKEEIVKKDFIGKDNKYIDNIDIDGRDNDLNVEGNVKVFEKGKNIKDAFNNDAFDDNNNNNNKDDKLSGKDAFSEGNNGNNKDDDKDDDLKIENVKNVQKGEIINDIIINENNSHNNNDIYDNNYDDNKKDKVDIMVKNADKVVDNLKDVEIEDTIKESSNSLPKRTSLLEQDIGKYNESVQKIQTIQDTQNSQNPLAHIVTDKIKRISVASLAENPELNDVSLDDDNYIQESPKEWGSQEWAFSKTPNSLKNLSLLFGSRSSTSSTITTPINERFDSRRTSNVSTVSSVSNYDLLFAKIERENQILQEDPKAKRISIQGIAELKRSFERVQNEAIVNSHDDDIDWDFWGQIISDYETVARTKSRHLSKAIQKGIPQALRGMIWQLMSKSKDAELEAKYSQLLKQSSPHEKMIVRDLNRTFPKHEFFRNQDGIGQEGLFNVVKAYSIYDPEVGYYEEAFCVLVKLMKQYNMRSHFVPGMDGLQLRLFQFDLLVEEMLPRIHSHLLAQGINSSMYASQWFMTLFAYKFPLSLVFRIYDTIFTEGIEAIFRFSIALLKRNEKKIVELNFEPLLEFLKSGLFESYQFTPTGVLAQLITETQYKTNDFVKDAYDIRITVKKLNRYQQAYYTHQENEKKRFIAEAEAAERIRVNNNHLSGKIKSLESSLQTLDREHVELANDFINTKMELAQYKDENDNLHQTIANLRRNLEIQHKEIESKTQDQMEDLAKKNIELVERNNLLEDQLSSLENMLIEIKMRYAESENEREVLKRKWNDLKKALG
ncbi:16202_t:CDS:2 [Entrophospora sp. SA101]|nr:16202_t:CDS:2 [Entrophospora sp. SA101]